MSTNPNPVATITLASGKTITAELYPHIAPNTVYNFIELANSGFYDNLTFHRIIPGFVIQGGDPAGDGTGGPGYCIKGEFDLNNHPNDLRHTKGVLSMARAQSYDSAGSQFFIMLGDMPHLDHQYAAFGLVQSGYEHVEALAQVPCDFRDRPYEPQIIQTIRVNTFGFNYPKAEKI